MRFKNIILFSLFPILGYSQVQIDGYVLDKIKSTPLLNSRVTLSTFERDSVIVIDSSEYHPYRKTIIDSVYKRYNRVFTDSAGYFLFSNLKPGVYKITAESLLQKTERGSYYEERESMICSATKGDSKLSKEIYLSVFCPFDATKNFKTCPVCGKDDKLRIFMYGLAIRQLDDDGNKYIYTGDCSPPRCKPAKYCLRCKLEF